MVPTGAEVLLATRLPFLTLQQRRDVLATTELPSGGPLDNGSGWSRLDLYKAASGYGAFNSDVTITQDATQGGFNAANTFDNDITGTGKLTKQDTGTLVLAGNNSFTGGTEVDGGVLDALTGSALGTGAASLRGGTLRDGAALLTLGGLSLDGTSTLQFDLSSAACSRELRLTGLGSLAGRLSLSFADSLHACGSESITIDASSAIAGDFSEIGVLGLQDGSYRESVVRSANGLVVTISDVPEPASFALVAAGLAAAGLVCRRKASMA